MTAPATTAPGTSTAPATDNGSNGFDGLAHIVTKTGVLEAAVNGVPVTALCSKTWMPTRDPGTFPLCPMCDAVAVTLWGTSDLSDVDVTIPSRS